MLLKVEEEKRQNEIAEKLGGITTGRKLKLDLASSLLSQPEFDLQPMSFPRQIQFGKWARLSLLSSLTLTWSLLVTGQSTTKSSRGKTVELRWTITTRHMAMAENESST